MTVLTNPASGHGNAPHAAERAITRLHHHGVDVVAIAGRDAVHARQLVEGALDRGMDALVVVGGDGIISLALQVLAQTDIPLGIVPAGTGNDHAREFGIPTRDPEAAADVIVDGIADTVDLGPHPGRRRHPTLVRHGDGGGLRLPGHRPHQPDALAARSDALQHRDARRAVQAAAAAVPVVVRRRRGLDTELTLAAFGNTRSYGGGMQICPDADPRDGLLDVTMVASASRSRLIRLFPTVFKGTHVNLDAVRTERARTITVDCPENPEITAYADGEYVCPLPVEVTAVPAALKLLRPA